jgi:hypothetical protein
VDVQCCWCSGDISCLCLQGKTEKSGCLYRFFSIRPKGTRGGGGLVPGLGQAGLWTQGNVTKNQEIPCLYGGCNISHILYYRMLYWVWPVCNAIHLHLLILLNYPVVHKCYWFRDSNNMQRQGSINLSYSILSINIVSLSANVRVLSYCSCTVLLMFVCCVLFERVYVCYLSVVLL